MQRAALSSRLFLPKRKRIYHSNIYIQKYLHTKTHETLSHAIYAGSAIPTYPQVQSNIIR